MCFMGAGERRLLGCRLYLVLASFRVNLDAVHTGYTIKIEQGGYFLIKIDIASLSVLHRIQTVEHFHLSTYVMAYKCILFSLPDFWIFKQQELVSTLG